MYILYINFLYDYNGVLMIIVLYKLIYIQFYLFIFIFIVVDNFWELLGIFGMVRVGAVGKFIGCLVVLVNFEKGIQVIFIVKLLDLYKIEFEKQ